MSALVAAALAGVLTWSFLEYVIHRWLGHDRRFRGNAFGVEHVRHHAEGNYFAPSWKKAIAAAAVAVLLGGPAVAVGGAPALAWLGGLLGFYGVYELLHRLEHVRPGRGPYARWSRRHHFTHHFVDARCNHGVTSPLWDLVFGTYRRPGVVAVPSRLAPPSIVDPATGEIRAQWRGAFTVGERPSGRLAP